MRNFFHGIICNENHDEWSFDIDIWYEDDKGKIYDLDMLYYKKFKTKEECKNAFFEAKIFDGKTFWEAESEMEWIPLIKKQNIEVQNCGLLAYSETKPNDYELNKQSRK